VRWIRINSATCDWGGRPASLGLITDVTARREAEDARKRIDAQYRAVVENTGDGIVVSQDGRIVFANPRMETLSG
jgi:two-component system sensor histidine kinase/response regulator